MPDILFRYKGPQGSVAPYGDPVAVSASVIQYWIGALSSSGYAPAVPAWVPTFEPNPTESVVDGGTGGTDVIGLNPRYFATAETVGELMKRYATAGVIGVALVPFQGGGGNVSSAAKERWVLLSGGFATNAGLLAGHFLDNPEDLAPTVADKAVRHDIEAAVASGQRLPAIT